IGPDYRKQRLEIKELEDLLPMVLQAFEEMGVPALLPPGLPQADGTVSMVESPNPLLVNFLAQKIPVDQIIENHPVHIDCVREYLLTDAGLNAHPVLKEALKVHIQMHFEADVQMRQFMQMQEIQANAPMMMESAQAADQQKAQGSKQKAGGKKKTATPSQANLPSGGAMQRRLPMASAGQQASGANPMSK